MPIQLSRTWCQKAPLPVKGLNCEAQPECESESVGQWSENQATESPTVRVQRRAAAEARDRVHACMIEFEDSD